MEREKGECLAGLYKSPAASLNPRPSPPAAAAQSGGAGGHAAAEGIRRHAERCWLECRWVADSWIGLGLELPPPRFRVRGGGGGWGWAVVVCLGQPPPQQVRRGCRSLPPSVESVSLTSPCVRRFTNGRTAPLWPGVGPPALDRSAGTTQGSGGPAAGVFFGLTQK